MILERSDTVATYNNGRTGQDLPLTGLRTEGKDRFGNGKSQFMI